MKRTFVMMSAMVAVIMVFAAAKAGAQLTNCASYDPTLYYQPPGWCFDSNGYTVRIANTDGSPIKQGGTFPYIDVVTGNSVFTYHFTKTDPKVKELVNWVDILMPSTCNPNLDPGNNYICYKGAPGGSQQLCYGNLFTNGSGDPLSGFGLGLTTQNTWKWGWTLSTKFIGLQEGTVSFTLPKTEAGVYATKGNMLLKLFILDFMRYPFGEILAPSCTLVSDIKFPAPVPNVTNTSEPTPLGTLACIEQSDASTGCPTKIYTCVSDDLSVTDPYDCTCPEGYHKDYWTFTPLSAFQIELNDLCSYGTSPIYDPRCPGGYFVTGCGGGSCKQPNGNPGCLVQRCGQYKGTCASYCQPCPDPPGASAKSALLSMVSQASTTTTSCQAIGLSGVPFKQEQINGQNICTYPDDSGCYTVLYTCPTPTTCDCRGSEICATNLDFSQVQVNTGTVEFVGANYSDPYCLQPFTDIVYHAPASTCVQRCNPYLGVCKQVCNP